MLLVVIIIISVDFEYMIEVVLLLFFNYVFFCKKVRMYKNILRNEVFVFYFFKFRFIYLFGIFLYDRVINFFFIL